jgi:hypothetical protein
VLLLFYVNNGIYNVEKLKVETNKKRTYFCFPPSYHVDSGVIKVYQRMRNVPVAGKADDVDQKQDGEWIEKSARLV